MATFRKVNLSVFRANGYGQYIVRATYYGKEIIARTTNSEIFEWLNDASNKAKHIDAKRSAYMLIRNTHEQASNY